MGTKANLDRFNELLKDPSLFTAADWLLTGKITQIDGAIGDPTDYKTWLNALTLVSEIALDAKLINSYRGPTVKPGNQIPIDYPTYDSHGNWTNDVSGGASTSKRGTLSGSIDDLTQAEKRLIDDLLDEGKNVEIIPRSGAQNVKTPDFRVDGVLTETKHLTGTSLNTPVTRIQDGFKQGAQAVIIDGRSSGISAEQAYTVLERVEGIYGGTLPGKVEIWTNEGIITGGK